MEERVGQAVASGKAEAEKVQQGGGRQVRLPPQVFRKVKTTAAHERRVDRQYSEVVVVLLIGGINALDLTPYLQHVQLNKTGCSASITLSSCYGVSGVYSIRPFRGPST